MKEKSQTKKIELLSIGHSYVVALNRSLMRELNKSDRVQVTVGAPKFFAGDLRPIVLEEEPAGSELKVVGLDCTLTSSIHLFWYKSQELKRLLKLKKWNYGYIWEEPYILSGFQLAQAMKEANVPYSLFTNQNIFKKYPWPFSYFEKQTLQACDSLWGCGPQVLETFHKKNYKGRSQVVPYFVNTDRFRPFTPAEKKHKRQEWGLQDVKTIGFMGRLNKEKGLEHFFHAVESLPREQPWQVLILGDGPMKVDVQNWIEKNNLKERAFLKLVKHEEVPGILPVMDVLMCPSQTTKFWREQFGRMIIEAFACGVTVIASDSGEIPFVVNDAGLIVPEANQAAWAQTLKNALFDDDLLHKMRERGFQRAKTFSIKTVAEQIEKIIVARVEQFK
jgi:glycosyltransferase involved in cell wall biosynthesis